MSLYVALFAPLVAANFVAARLWGGRSELAVASAYLAATVFEKACESFEGPTFAMFEPLIAIIDFALALWLILAAVRNPQTWILCAAAIQLVVSFAHIGKLLDPSMSRLAYAILTGSGGYPSQILLSIGIASHAMHARKAERLR